MAKLVQDQHYVNFLRGTPTAWEKLEVKDPDTLYFISEKNSLVGQLYLGNKLISSSLDKVTIESLSGISKEDLENGELLVYNNESESWENKNIADIIAPIIKVMTGATEKFDGISGLVPMPEAGQQDYFLKGDGTWAKNELSAEDKEALLEEIAASLYWDNF